MNLMEKEGEVMEIWNVSGVEIDVVFKEIKNIHLSVLPPAGRPRLSAPHGTDPALLRVFLIGKMGWMRTKALRFSTGEIIGEPKDFIAGESHYLFGRRYRLKTSVGSENSIVLGKNVIHATMTPRTTSSLAERRKFFRTWFDRILTERVSELLRIGRTDEEPPFVIRGISSQWYGLSGKGGFWISRHLVHQSDESIKEKLLSLEKRRYA